MAKYIIVSLAFVAAAIAVTSAASQEEKDAIKAAVMPIFHACGEEFSVSKDDLKAAKKSKNIDAIDPCYYACVYKKMGFLNEEGLFDAAVAKEKKTKFLSNEDDIQKASEVTETCASVNDESVSDGAKGCDRAKLLTTCFFKELKGYKSLLAESEE